MKNGDHLTLHYRLATVEGRDIVNTFTASPATFTLGEGHLAEPLEQLLMTLETGVRKSFRLPPNTVFGQYREDLRRFFSSEFLFDELKTDVGQLHTGDVIEVPLKKVGSEGAAISASVSAVEDTGVWLDFNHPLAHHALIFEAEIRAVL